ncbi:Copia protein [Eumeta japonica]|uniref:Copia protein n=1 Tax=Eumeta variegata TaxID=151549 RepID=A0A4C1X9Z2_EUMVA|nr:Copia protein [Eumeta japonica]
MIMDSTGNIKFVAERRGDLYYLQEGNEEADIVEDKTNSEFLMCCRMGHLNANDLVRVINQNTTKKIKYLQSDNGKEYCNAEMDNFLRNQGIQRRLSVVRTPQQNGVAERFNRTIVEMARCLLLQSSLSDMFWADAVATACHLRNRCPSRSINGDTPYQRWFNRDKMSLNYLRAFGSTVYVLDKNPAKGFGNNNEIEAQAEIPEDLEDNEENEKSSGVQSSIHETQEESQEKKLKKKNEDLETKIN